MKNDSSATPQRTKDEQKAVDLAERVRGFGARASGEGEVMQLCSAVISLADKVRDLRSTRSETAEPDAIAQIRRVQEERKREEKALSTIRWRTK